MFIQYSRYHRDIQRYVLSLIIDELKIENFDTIIKICTVLSQKNVDCSLLKTKTKISLYRRLLFYKEIFSYLKL